MTLTWRTWDTIKDRRERRVMTRTEDEALRHYWRVRRYARRHQFAHGDQLLHAAECRLELAVASAVLRDRMRPLAAALASMNRGFVESLASLNRGLLRAAETFHAAGASMPSELTEAHQDLPQEDA